MSESIRSRVRKVTKVITELRKANSGLPIEVLRVSKNKYVGYSAYLMIGNTKVRISDHDKLGEVEFGLLQFRVPVSAETIIAAVREQNNDAK